MSKNRLAGPIIAIVITIVFVVWMLSGQSQQNTTSGPQAPEKNLTTTVQVVTSEARVVDQTLEINGITEAVRFVTVRSEASGKVIKVSKRHGDFVEKGDIIAQLDQQDIPARLKQAEAYEVQTRLEYEGAQRLRKQGLQNEATVARALTTHEQAKAQLATLKLQQANTTIRAPFSGQVENMTLEPGAYIRPGDAIADIYDYSKLTFVGSIAEKDISSVKLGQSAVIRMINGETAAATVSFIGSVANPATRTFTVELSITEAGRDLSGITSMATVDLEDTRGHYVSPALLYINDSGDMGLKVVNASDQVEFRGVSIIRSATDGVWVDGLAERENIIVVGQGFVKIGDDTVPSYRDFNPNVAVGL